MNLIIDLSNIIETAVQDLGGDKVAYKVSDAGSARDRQDLLEWIKAEHPDVNALINNTGIQRRIAPSQDNGSWDERAAEIEINLNKPFSSPFSCPRRTNRPFSPM